MKYNSAAFMGSGAVGIGTFVVVCHRSPSFNCSSSLVQRSCGGFAVRAHTFDSLTAKAVITPKLLAVGTNVKPDSPALLRPMPQAVPMKSVDRRLKTMAGIAWELACRHPG